MADKVNFLLGVGDYFTENIDPPKRKPDKKLPYTLERAKERLAPQAQATAVALDALPQEACPRNEAVAVLTLHPEFLAKSFYPAAVLRDAGLEPIGSRPVIVDPESRTLKKAAKELPSTALFVAGDRRAFDALPRFIGSVTEASKSAIDLPKLESLKPLTAQDRLKAIPARIKEPLLELVLHAGLRRRYVIEAFEAYARSLDVAVDFDRQFLVGDLTFLPARGPRKSLERLAEFTFLRVARLMPKLRPLEAVRSKSFSFPVTLPKGSPIDPSLHIAVFDGGMPPSSCMDPWVNAFDAPGVTLAVPEYVSHGANVTSALLFGPLTKGDSPTLPFATVDHYRVLDEQSHQDEDLYDVLHRIESVLLSNPYRFVGLSLGPDKPIQDDDVDAWTSVLDGLLSDGETLATIAVGNGGDRDAALGFNRVQVPADCVNAIGVGAADTRGKKWSRAEYSSIGPGRSPGLVKPDGMSFGGSLDEPFWVLEGYVNPIAVQQVGTSFAAPNVLRMAAGIRAHFGDLLSPLAIRTLLLHCTAEAKAVAREEVGWGLIPDAVEEFVICPEGVARVVYQGELRAGQYMRARVPIPDEPLDGKVKIRATFCYACQVDPAHPGNYTRAGLDVWFRPHDKRFSKDAEDPSQPKSVPFFRLKEFSTERDLRRDAHKWETILHRERSMLGASLRNPVFDVHYNARVGGHSTQVAEKIKYSLVITMTSPRTKDLYDRIVRRYPTQIRQLTPVVTIPIRTRGG